MSQAVTAPQPGTIRLMDAIKSDAHISLLSSLNSGDFVPGVMGKTRVMVNGRVTLVDGPITRQRFESELRQLRVRQYLAALSAEEDARKAAEAARKEYLVSLPVPCMPKTSIAPKDVLRHARRASKAFLMMKVRFLFGAPRRRRPRTTTAAAIFTIPRPQAPSPRRQGSQKRHRPVE